MKVILKTFFLALIFSSCMVQYSSLKKVRDSDVPLPNMGVIKYYGQYKMNMSKSEDIIITLRNLNSGQEYMPSMRTQDGMSVISVPEGEYVLSKLIMRETNFTKCLCKVEETDKFIYGFSDRNCNNLNKSGLLGNLLSGGLLLGEKYLVVNDTIIVSFKIKSGEVYTADSLLIKGKIESLLKDLPNIEITQTNSKNTSNKISFFSEGLIVICRRK